MFSFGFYNSIDHDRVYDATQFGSIFDGVITDGVYANIGELFATVPGNGFQVVVKTGRAWFNHTWSLNDSYLPLELDSPDMIQTRIDAVVLEVDTRVESRKNSIKIVKGIPSVNPVRPQLLNAGGVFQHPLAFVTLKPEATAVLAENIELVVGKDECPFVTSPLKTVSITDLFNTWNGEFNTWFDNLKAQLSDNVVTNLQNQIDEKVNLKDLATGDDIKNETPGKWVDAAGLASYGRYLSLTPGQTMYSPNENLEEMFPGEFMACDQRTITDSELVAELRKGYFRPSEISPFPTLSQDVAKDALSFIPTTTSGNYFLNLSTPLVYGDKTYYLEGKSNGYIMEYDTKTHKVSTINLHSIITVEDTIISSFIYSKFLFMIGWNSSDDLLKCHRLDLSLPTIGVTTSVLHQNRISYVYKNNSSFFIKNGRISFVTMSDNQNIYYVYTDTLFDTCISGNINTNSMTPKILCNLHMADTVSESVYGNTDGRIPYVTRPMCEDGVYYFVGSVAKTDSALTVGSVLWKLDMTVDNPTFVKHHTFSWSAASKLNLISSMIIDYGIFDGKLYIWAIGVPVVNTTPSSTFSYNIPVCYTLDLNTRTEDVKKFDYGTFIQTYIGVGTNRTSTAISTKPFPIIKGKPRPCVYKGRRYFLFVNSDVYTPRYGECTSSQTNYFRNYIIERNAMVMLSPDTMEMDIFKINGNKIYGGSVTSHTKNFIVISDRLQFDGSYVAAVKISTIVGDYISERRRSKPYRVYAESSAPNNTQTFVIIDANDVSRVVIFSVESVYTYQSQIIEGDDELFFFCSNLSNTPWYTSFKELVLPYEPGSYIRLPKTTSTEEEGS